LGQSWVATAALRLDHWRNFDAFSNSISLLKRTVTRSQLPEKSETAFSPRLSLLRHLTGNWSVAAAVYRSFRAPTLNELYRPFRVGDILTLANDSLRAERLTGGEASLIGRASGKASFRGTFFWEDVSRPVANLTLSVTPQLITRQRQNLGRTRSRGLELQADARVTGNFTIAGGYQFADTVVLEFPADSSLLGLEVPQVPRHQFTVQARYQKPSFATVALQGRYVGRQFDDDRNQFPLDAYFTVDAFASHRVNRTVEIFAAAENLFNQRYMVGRTPMISLGPPLLARIGLRFDLSRQ
jgi:outer membrane receptor protein involved in Fe transport